MKRIASCFTVVGATLLSGCAGWGGSSAPAYAVDQQRVGAIEAAAKRTGVQVIWLNQPTRKTATAGG